MKFNWLIFHYDFNKLSSFRDDFKGHDSNLTFKYACASLKTFAAHNPERTDQINVWTDDPDLMYKILDENNIKKPKNIFDIKDEINYDKQHHYPWKVKSGFLERHMKDHGFFVDNDCITKKNVDSLVDKLDDDHIVLWEFEKFISNSRPYWGWQMATEYLKRPMTYWIANEGIIGLSKKNLINNQIMSKSSVLCEDIYYNVDVSSRFPDRHPKIMIAQQMAMCFAAQDLNLNLIESKDYFDHFYTDKTKCLEYL